MGDLLPPRPRAASLDPRAEVDRILSGALDDAARTMAAAAAGPRQAGRHQVEELDRHRDSILASAREVHHSTVRAIDAMANAVERLAALAGAERTTLPRWPPRARNAVEVKLSEVREITLRFGSGERT